MQTYTSLLDLLWLSPFLSVAIYNLQTHCISILHNISVPLKVHHRILKSIFSLYVFFILIVITSPNYGTAYIAISPFNHDDDNLMSTMEPGLHSNVDSTPSESVLMLYWFPVDFIQCLWNTYHNWVIWLNLDECMFRNSFLLIVDFIFCHRCSDMR